MKGKHLHIDSHRELWALIRKKVNTQLELKPESIRTTQWLKFLFYGGLSISFYVLLYFPTTPFLFILNYIALGLTLLLFAFNFAHDFSHNTIFKDKKWNNLGFIALYTLLGAHAEAWRERHVNAHHFAPNVQRYDTDLQITSLIRVSPETNFRWYHKFQFIYAPLAYSSYSLYWIFIKDSKVLINDIRKDKLNFRYFFSFMTQKVFYIFYLLIAPLSFSYQNVEIVLMGFFLMHLIQSVFLLFTFFMTHHVLGTSYPETDCNGTIQTSWFMNQIKSSNDMYPFSKTANFFLGGFNNHIAHHLFPHIHHIHYPKLNEILYRTLEEYDITPNQTSYLGGVLSHLRLLKKLGRKNNTYEFDH